ncbi:D-inositol-3-phosphate glycosyltransferase [Sinomonas cellulolyticus]|uniref:D-inositol-3-phosphate glycosyltransferase n=1 Tax=Sinomonas cellulolyticus TaxID=2801916 RepID=A0ABS1JZU5_9MICC|nr:MULTISPECIES: D-inositol-3-phosphate glycosyltransferase [Sinomonas]MBL0704723.1 D-inositol-3-phosphate glycosyltransferase [Sinomonas cellulolyticus]
MISLHTSPLEQPGAGDAGGMNVYVSQLARALAAGGLGVDIYTRATSAEQPETVPLADGVLVHHVEAGPLRRLAKEQMPPLVAEFAAGMLARIEGGESAVPRVVHSHYWVSGMAGLEVSRELGVPLVHTMHTMARVKNLHLAAGDVPEPSNRERGEQRLADEAARFTANTAMERDELVRHYGVDDDRIDVVSPGVDLDVFRPAFRGRSRMGRGVRAADFHVLFAGRIQRLKGPQVLVAAAAELRRRRPDIPLRVTVVGAPSGSAGLDLDLLAEAEGLGDRVRRLPPVPAAELAEWYRSADVVAMPSFSESFGLVALEAQACGTPVVAARVGGLTRAVCDGRTGFLVDGHEPSRWAAVLEQLHDDPETRWDLGRAASIYAERFGWEETAEGTRAAYRTALREQAPATLG